MTTFTVSIRLEAASSEEVITRIGKWDLAKEEGVTSISTQPEMIQIPQELMTPPAPMPKMMEGIAPLPAPVSSPLESPNGD